MINHEDSTNILRQRLFKESAILKDLIKVEEQHDRS